MFGLLACAFAAHLVGAPSPSNDTSLLVTCSRQTSYCDASEASLGSVRVCFDDDFAANGKAHFALGQSRLRKAAKACDLYVVAAHKGAGLPDDAAAADDGDVLRRFCSTRQRVYVVYTKEQVRLGTLEIRDTLGLDSARWALSEMWVTSERLDQMSFHILSDGPSYPVYKGRFGSTTGHVMGSAQAFQTHADGKGVGITIDAACEDDKMLMLSALMAMHMRQVE